MSVNTQLQATIPDVYAISPASTAKNTIYLGYGPASLILQAMPEGGSASYTYSWSTGATTESIAVGTAGTYYVTVTDSKGCETAASIIIRTQDVTCGNGNDKVLICHNGNPLCVAASAVQAHISHGDKLGSCENGTILANQGQAAKELTLFNELEESKVVMYPNPAADYIYISGLDSKTYQYNLFNLGGSKVSNGVLLDGKINLPASIVSGNYLLQIMESGKPTISKQIIIQK